MINSVTLVGRLTADPEQRTSQSGTMVTTFNLAVNRTYKQDGQPEADFLRIITFGKQAENCFNFLYKGAMAGIKGRIQTGSYEKDGVMHYTTDIVAQEVAFLTPKNDSQQQKAPQQQAQQTQITTAPQQQQHTNQYNQPYQQQTQTANTNNPFNNASGPIDISDDMLPF